MKRQIFSVVICFLLAVSLIGNGYLFYQVNQLSKKVSTNQSSSTTQTVTNMNYDVTNDMVDVIKKVENSVVGISVVTSNGTGSGSGFIYSVEGNTVYVVTNHHVIENAKDIGVAFPNEEAVSAELVGSDKYGDIALLKMTVDFDVSALKIGDSSLLDKGETILVIGSPLGLEYAGSVADGIISAVNRTVSVDLNEDGTADWDMNVIQTNAAINPGNSGGPMINMAGEVVGIASMKFSDTAVEGMGFALPINDAVKLIEEIKATGSVERPVLGVSIIPLSGYTQWQLQMYNIQVNVDDGLYVQSVSASSPASRAGIQRGDVIVEVEGKKITTYKDFLTELLSKRVGDTIEIKINRQGKDITIKAQL